LELKLILQSTIQSAADSLFVLTSGFNLPTSLTYFMMFMIPDLFRDCCLQQCFQILISITFRCQLQYTL